METLELKSNIHKIIDEIKNEHLLQTLYDFLKYNEKKQSKGVWSSLTEAQKNEILLSFDESELDENLIPAENIFKRK